MSPLLRTCLLLPCLLLASPAVAGAPKATPAAAKAAVSDVLRAPRPAGGEWFGLYLLDKKIGYTFVQVAPVPGRKDQVRSVSELVFKAQVGTRTSERYMREERVYEARPGGRLLSFSLTQRGDGGDQVLEGTATPKGLRVVRRRPQRADEVLELPPTAEQVENADAARVALLRKAELKTTLLDALDLKDYAVTTTVQPAEERLLGGVRVRVQRATTVSQKDQVPITSWVAEDGRLLELDFAGAMQARAEPEATAKRLDMVEVFGLTRIPLPGPLPTSAQAVPGQLALVVEGLPESLQRDTYRQRHERLEQGRVRVTLSARPPQRLQPRPLQDPEGGANLAADLAVESKDKEIRSLAQQLVGSQKDAYTAARTLNSWVARNLEKDYGASADRATDVLRQRKGDCTEHSLLTVALLRAAGIPARRVDGLVYLRNSDGVPALYWHQWVEAWVGEWTQMDPTFDQPVADATHLAFGREGQAQITPLFGKLRVLEVK